MKFFARSVALVEAVLLVFFVHILSQNSVSMLHDWVGVVLSVITIGGLIASILLLTLMEKRTMSLSREDFEKIIGKIDQTYPWKHELNYLKDHDHAQRERIRELEQWQKIILHTEGDQEAIIRMQAAEYTKIAIQSWKDKVEQQAKEIERLKNELQYENELNAAVNHAVEGHLERHA